MMERPPLPALLLLGHGSHLSATSSQPIRELALALMRRGPFTEVRVGFWKEDPHLHHALDTVEATEVFVVPIFTSTGYFTDRVLPRELGLGETPLGGPHEAIGPRRVHYCVPVGTHPGIADLVLDRARAATADEQFALGDGPVALIVVGHGTPRHPDSGRVTHELAAALGPRWPHGPVRAAFLDEEPGVDEVLRSERAPRLVVVPFFMSAGWHAGTTLPGDLGVDGGEARLEGRTIRYTPPVGTHPGLADMVLEIVAEAGRSAESDVGPHIAEDAGRRTQRDAARPAGRLTGNVAGRRTDDAAPAGPPTPSQRGLGPTTPAAEAKSAFIGWITGSDPEGRTFLQVRIRPTSSGRFDVCHVDDVPPAPEHEKAGPSPHREHDVSSNPRDALRFAATTDEGLHRPLRTAPDLRRGWRLVDLSASEVWEAVGLLYPAAAVHWHLGREDALPVRSYPEAASRQTGMFASLSELPESAVVGVAASCCRPDRCLREPLWWPAVERAAGEPGRTSVARVPCPEPCSVLLAAALEVRRAHGKQ